MANTMTDHLGLVQVGGVKEAVKWFGRAGFCLEVFRGNTLLGSILFKDAVLAGEAIEKLEQLGTRAGDTLLRVSLSSKIFIMKGQLFTKDRYVRGYEIELEIKVIDSSAFALRYKKQDDPIRFVTSVLEGDFLQYAQLRSHDDLTEEALRYRAMNTLRIGSNKLVGIEVVSVHSVRLVIDARRAQMLEILRQERLEREQIKHAELILKKMIDDEQDYHKNAKQQENLRKIFIKREIFLCYAHEDEVLKKKLEKHLSSLKRQGVIDVWNDSNISAGIEWKREIDKHLNTAEIFLLLISPDFMDSDFCYDVEMKRAIERHEQGEARVIPVILRPIYWYNAPFSKLQPLPTNGKPVTDPDWHDLDRAFNNIVEGIIKVVDELPSS